MGGRVRRGDGRSGVSVVGRQGDRALGHVLDDPVLRALDVPVQDVVKLRGQPTEHPKHAGEAYDEPAEQWVAAEEHDRHG